LHVPGQSVLELQASITMTATRAPRRQRGIQKQVSRAAKKHPQEEAKPMQAGARRYPVPPFPKQHQSKPGSEAALKPAPLYDAPFYRGSGKLQGKIEHEDARRTREMVGAEGKKCILIAGDVSSQRFWERAGARTVKQFRRLDVLVNNAAFQVHTARHFDDPADHGGYSGG
jgi:hypothetical protein